MVFKKIITPLVFSLGCTSTAHADFHKWEITELFSNADGSVQFIELFTPDDGQELLNSSPDTAQLSSTDGITTNLMASFPNDLPSDLTANRFFLIGTTAYAGLDGAVTPDYILPDQFLFTGGGTVVFADVSGPISTVAHGALPIDGILSFNADGSTGINSPTNFAGATGSINAPAPVPVPTAVWLFASGLLGLVGVARRRDGER